MPKHVATPMTFEAPPGTRKEATGAAAYEIKITTADGKQLKEAEINHILSAFQEALKDQPAEAQHGSSQGLTPALTAVVGAAAGAGAQWIKNRGEGEATAEVDGVKITIKGSGDIDRAMRKAKELLQESRAKGELDAHHKPKK